MAKIKELHPKLKIEVKGQALTLSEQMAIRAADIVLEEYDSLVWKELILKPFSPDLRSLFQFAFIFVIKNYMDDDQEQINMVNSFISLVRWK